MLIAVNAGNSRVLLGGYEEDGQVFSASIATEPKLTRDDYACKLQQVLLLYGVNVRRIHGGIVSSVVPSMVGVLEGALRLLGIRDVIEVSSGVKTGLNIRSEQPRQVGSGPRSRCGGRPCQRESCRAWRLRSAPRPRSPRSTSPVRWLAQPSRRACS